MRSPVHSLYVHTAGPQTWSYEAIPNRKYWYCLTNGQRYRIPDTMTVFPSCPP